MKYLLVALIVAGCSQVEQPQPISIISEPLSRPTLSLPPVDSFDAADVSWTIVTEANSAEVFDKLRAEGKTLILYAVTVDGYRSIVLNNAQSLKVITQQRAVINGYKTYYVRADGVIYQYNQKLTDSN